MSCNTYRYCIVNYITVPKGISTQIMGKVVDGEHENKLIPRYIQHIEHSKNNVACL